MQEVKRVPIPSDLAALLRAKRDRHGERLAAELLGLSTETLHAYCRINPNRQTMPIKTLDTMVTRLNLDVNIIYEAERAALALQQEKRAKQCHKG